MIICSASNIDLIQGQGTEGYGNADGTTDWRITNTPSATLGLTGVFNIFNSVNPTTPSISILESGTVGIGTVPNVSSAAKMEIIGGINISGSYNRNNRDVINDTSNYILNTSNILVSRINAGGGSGGAITSGGNLTLTNNATSNTVLSIANSNVVYGTSNYTSNVITGSSFVADFSGVGNTAPSVHEAVSGSTTERIMIFRTAGVNHTFTVPAGGLNCDILMIGGGGGVLGATGAGAGAGACIVAINQTLPAGSCVVNVGVGGTTDSTSGNDSFIKVATLDRYRAKGGGSSAYTSANSFDGGCGGGAKINGDTTPEAGGAAVSTNVVNGVIENTPPRITSTYAVMGNAGGNNGTSTSTAGSGGGIGAVGVAGGKGGDGAYQVTLTGAATPINFRGYFANGGNSFGVLSGGQYYIGGGGGGYQSGYQAAGLGGGGTGNLGSGVANTGSGGANGGEGGTGIIIIRYRSVTTITTPTPATAITTTFGTPLIELIRGTSSDSNTDYKLGNYNGDFKVISSISNTDTERLLITSSGNVGIGTTNPVNELHFFDSLTSSTSLTIQNSNISFIATPVITPTNVSGGTFTVGQTTGSIDRFMIFTAGTSSFTVPAGGIICDILMIGGGGAGGWPSGGGGGAGACIVSINQSFTTGTYNVAVGAGDGASGSPTGAGGDSTIAISGGSTLYIARGGGRGESQNYGRNNGGCGGGSGSGAIKTGGTALNTNMVAGTLVDANARSATFAVFGNKGGDRPDTTSGVTGTGGGGIGGAGGNHIASSVNAGPGGVGLFQATVGGMTYNFRNYFANNGSPYNFGALNSVDSQYYIGGGGGGSVNANSLTLGPNVGGVGGAGGGGNGGITSTFVAATGATGPAVNPTAGATNTGSGGGASYNNSVNAGNGGSGIVIIRYRVAPVTIGVPSVELVRGVAGDSNHDFKLGNYNGDFKIMSAVSGTADVERLNISSVGNVGIGTNSPANELHIFDNTTTATSLIIQNNNQIVTSNIVQGTSTVQGSVTTGGITTSTFTADFTGSTAPSVHEAVAAAPTDKIMIFRAANTDHAFTIPSGGLNCDILMIGGGGANGQGCGGGAGACIVAINQTLPAGSCIVNVGAAGGNNYDNSSTIAPDSFIKVNNTDRYRAKGGGGGGNFSANGNSGYAGGCGGGSAYQRSGNGGSTLNTNVVTLNDGSTTTKAPSIDNTHRYAVMGNAGGTSYSGGAGGGIGTAGVAAGKGGDGRYFVEINGTTYNFREWFANGGNSFGVLHTDTFYYIGGGGGGYNNNTWQNNGIGSSNGVGNLGSGKSGSGDATPGIVIIRYRSVTTTNTTVTTTTYTHTPTLTTTLSTPTLLGNSSIELVRGTQGDSNTDYKLGNYGGDFKVISSSLSTDTDRLNITSAGNVGIGTTSPQVKLHVTGEVYATGNITAYFSDERLKTKISSIHNPLEIIRKLNGFYYIPNDLAHFNGITNTDKEVGLSAQEVQRVLPEVVKIAPFDSIRNTEGVIVSKSGENYLTMSYERLTPVFVEAIKELEQRNIELSQEITLINETLRSL
jgi:hypothetical protein